MSCELFDVWCVSFVVCWFGACCLVFGCLVFGVCVFVVKLLVLLFFWLAFRGVKKMFIV